MLSRVADAIYWMNRYIERADNVARFVDVNLHLMLDLPDGAAQWAPLVATTGDDAWFRAKYGDATRANVMQFLTFDTEYPHSILSSLRAARENARSVREIISTEMWEQVNKAYLRVIAASSDGTVFDTPHEFYADVRAASYFFVGVTYTTMTHNEAWHFGRLARLVERADKTSRIVDVKYYLLLPDPRYVGSPYDELQWAALLKSASALEMYRKRFGRIVPARVIEFLLFDKHFPRAMQYCVVKAERSLHAITRTRVGVNETIAEEHMMALREQIERGDVAKVIDAGVHEYLDDFQTRLNEVTAAIQATFFTLRAEPPKSSPADQ